MDINAINTVYDALIVKHGLGSVQSMGWSSQEKQEKRYNVLHGIGIKYDDSVLDVGCGCGDYLMYFEQSVYTGIDCNSAMIACAKDRFHIGNFIIGTLDGQCDRYDWVIASGLFALDCENWSKSMCNTLMKMFELCNKGIAANFLTWYKGCETIDNRHFSQPENILSKGRAVCDKVTLRMDYDMHDCTLYLYR